MKSVKPGRGPSMMGGIVSVCIGVFGIIWTIAAASMGGGFFALFGVVFVIIAIVQAVYNFKNATSKNRFSEFDITDSSEESDPFNDRFGVRSREENEFYKQSDGFCPYCGERTESDYLYCKKCGRKL